MLILLGLVGQNNFNGTIMEALIILPTVFFSFGSYLNNKGSDQPGSKLQEIDLWKNYSGSSLISYH